MHNSGHWTQSGCNTCQFENHLRAILDLPLGSTDVNGIAGMLNLLGNKQPPLEAIGHNSTLNWYNKSPRPGRKLGHVNFVYDSRELLLSHMQEFEKVLSDKPGMRVR